jgi:DNA transformation protein
MGKKGDKMTTAATPAAEGLLDALGHLGDMRLRKMFGGYGVFEETTMFALVDKAGHIFFKADAANLNTFLEAGAEKHARMPYYQVPESVLTNETELEKWAQSSLLVAKKK